MMELRFAALEDVDELIRLRFEFFEEEPEWILDETQKGVFAVTLREYFLEHLNRDFFAALVISGGIPAAAAFLAVHSRPANIRFPTGKTGELLNVYTRREYRGKGFAGAALKLLIDKAKEINLSFIELSATDAGKRVYEKLGFRENPPRHFTEMTLYLP